MKHLIIALALTALFSTAALAQSDSCCPSMTHTTKSTKTAKAKKSALVCPVTGIKIASVKAAAGHSAYKGKTYYFCCGECKPKFDKAPAKYIKNAAAGKYEKM